MKKIALFGLLLTVFTTMASAQFRHSVGGGLIFGTGKVPAGANSSSYDKPSYAGYGVFYYPRVNFTEMGGGSISAGIPLTLGASGSVNSRTGGNLSVVADLPLTVDYNFGAGSSDEDESNFGGFVGVGFGYTYSNFNETYAIGTAASDTYTSKGRSYGPLVNGGFKASFNDRTYFLRVSYKLGLEKEKFNTIGLAVGIDL
jgi:hypothetical protein